MATPCFYPRVVKKKAKEQTVVQFSGNGDLRIRQITDGHFVELNLKTDPPCYRRLTDTGVFCRQVLRYDPLRPGWILADHGAPEKLLTASAGEPVPVWESNQWRIEGSDAELQVRQKALKDLPKAAKREAQAMFEKPKAWTKWQGHECPTCCKDESAKSWGLPSLLDLYAHVCFYHRNTQQYYQLYEQYWDESVAEALRNREESSGELLRKFEESMHRVGYERKTQTLKVKDHVRHLQKVEELLKEPLSRRLPEDENVFETIKGTREDDVSHGHYSTSLRWFRKWVEVAVIEEVLAAGGDAGAQRASTESTAPQQNFVKSLEETRATEPEARATGPETKKGTKRGPEREEKKRTKEPKSKKVKKHKDEREDDLELEDEEVKRSRIGQAADPFWAILQLDSRVACPRSSVATQTANPTANPASRTSDQRPENKEAEVVSRLSKWYGQISEGHSETAHKIASKVEKIGEKHGLTAVLTGTALFDPEVIVDLVDYAWLWSYCGTQDRCEILKKLCQHALRRWGFQEGFKYLMKRLLCVARSPHRAPVDVLQCVPEITALAEKSRVDMKQLEKLAKKQFSVKMKGLKKEDKPVSEKLVHFGCWLAVSMSNWPDSEKAVTEWWSSFSVGHSGLLDWYHRCCFANGFLWNFCPSKALEMMQPFVTNMAASSEQRKDLKNLQALAAKSFAQAESSMAAQPVTEGSRLVQDAAEVPPAQDIQDVQDARNVQIQDVQVEVSPAPSNDLRALQATIQRNREAALERKRLRESLEPAAHESVGVEVARPIATPMVDTRPVLQSIEELDKHGRALPIEGRIMFRSDHRSGTGFHVRVSDASGAIDLKFFGNAAEKFRHNEALVKGALIRASGFRLCKITGRGFDFAPAGRRNELRCEGPEAKIEQREAPAVKSEELGLEAALAKPVGTVVTIAQAIISKVDDLEEQVIPGGEMRSFRAVWLKDLKAPDSFPPVRWGLWHTVAEQYGHKQLPLGAKVKIKGTKVKHFRVKELTGCWREGGIQILSA